MKGRQWGVLFHSIKRRHFEGAHGNSGSCKKKKTQDWFSRTAPPACNDNSYKHQLGWVPCIKYVSHGEWCFRLKAIAVFTVFVSTGARGCDHLAAAGCQPSMPRKTQWHGDGGVSSHCSTKFQATKFRSAFVNHLLLLQNSACEKNEWW